MNLNEISQVQQVSQITSQHVQTMKDMVNNGKRAEVYTYYSNRVNSAL